MVEEDGVDGVAWLDEADLLLETDVIVEPLKVVRRCVELELD
jgi:hypothetical protein